MIVPDFMKITIKPELPRYFGQDLKIVTFCSEVLSDYVEADLRTLRCVC